MSSIYTRGTYLQTLYHVDNTLVLGLFSERMINFPSSTEGAIKNGQSRETDNIGYTSNRVKTNKRKTQHRKLKR